MRRNISFTTQTNPSHHTPHRGAACTENLYLLLSELLIVSTSCQCTPCSNFAAPWKLIPLSVYITLTLRRLAINLHKVIMKLAVDNESVSSLYSTYVQSGISYCLFDAVGLLNIFQSHQVFACLIQISLARPFVLLVYVLVSQGL